MEAIALRLEAITTRLEARRPSRYWVGGNRYCVGGHRYWVGGNRYWIDHLGNWVTHGIGVSAHFGCLASQALARKEGAMEGPLKLAGVDSMGSETRFVIMVLSEDTSSLSRECSLLTASISFLTLESPGCCFPTRRRACSARKTWSAWRC